MSAREEAIEAMAGTLGRHGVASINFVHWTKTCRCGWVRKVGPDGMTADEWDEAHYLHRMEEALDAILAPRIEKGPIAYLAADARQVGWWFPNLTNRRLYPMGHSDALYKDCDGKPVYILRDESPKGGA